MPPPIGFRWADKEWHLDESGPWMDSVLGIGECAGSLIETKDDFIEVAEMLYTNRMGFIMYLFFTLLCPPSPPLDYTWNLKL